MPYTYIEAKKKFDQLISDHQGIKTVESDQTEFIKKANRTITLKLFSKTVDFNFFKPKLNINGVCAALVSEWYRYHLSKRDFLKEINAAKVSAEVIQRVSFLHNQQAETVADANIDLQKKEYVRLFDLETLLLERMDFCNLEKIYGLACQSVELQSNWKNKDDIFSHYSFSSKNKGKVEINLHMKKNLPSSLVDFANVLDESLKNNFVNHLKQINLSYVRKKQTGHCVGLTAFENASSQPYFIFYDPNFGEVVFASLENTQKFLKAYVKFFYELLSNDNHLKSISIVSFTNQVTPTLTSNPDASIAKRQGLVS